MYRFSTFPASGAPEDPRAEDAATVAAPSAPDLPPPQALINKAHPSARIAVRRKLNIKQIPFVLMLLYIAAGAPGTAKGAAAASNVQQEMLALPGADDLREGLVLGFLDRRKCQYEAISEQIDPGLR